MTVGDTPPVQMTLPPIWEVGDHRPRMTTSESFILQLLQLLIRQLLDELVHLVLG